MSVSFGTYQRDLLLEIFDYLLPSDPTQLKKKHLTLTRLRRVCSYWNTIITTTAHFWLSLYILFPTKVIPIPILELWLERSGDASLAISIDATSHAIHSSDRLRILAKLMSTINSHISRCGSLRLEITAGLLPGLQSLVISNAERLERFSVDMCGTTDERVHATMIQQLTSLRSLRHVSFTSHFPSVLASLLKYSNQAWLSQLVSIETRCPVTPYEAFDLLARCTSATHISLSHVRSGNLTTPLEPTSRTSTTITILPTLRSLDISLTSATYLDLVQRFALPNLHTFKISGIDISTLSSTTPFYTSSEHLTVLHTNLSPSKDNIASLTAFLHDSTIVRIPILTIRGREFNSWDEYEEWLVSVSSTDEYDPGAKRRLREVVENFNRSHRGLRMMKFSIGEEWDRGYLIGWGDETLRGANIC